MSNATKQNPPVIGFLGLGSIGAPMAQRILQAGYKLIVYDIRPEAIGPKQDIAHGGLDLGGNRRHAPGELPLERTDVVVDAQRLEMLLQLPGECFTRPTLLLEKNQGPHGTKQRSCRPFE